MSAPEPGRERAQSGIQEPESAGSGALQPDEISADQSSAADAQSDDRYVRFRRSHFYASLVPVALVAGLAAGYLLWGRDGGQSASVRSAGPAEQARFDVSTGDNPSLGPADAQVTIIEFSDFNCPYCRQFHQATFRELLAAYPDQIRFVYRDYPITSQQSFLAAQAAECAGKQGSFWDYHDALFSGRFDLSPSAYRQYADDLGLDSEELMRCVESGQFADEVQADARYAASLGLSGTPTFFINGIPLVGAQPLSEFERIIEAELN